MKTLEWRHRVVRDFLWAVLGFCLVLIAYRLAGDQVGYELKPIVLAGLLALAGLEVQSRRTRPSLASARQASLAAALAVAMASGILSAGFIHEPIFPPPASVTAPRAEDQFRHVLIINGDHDLDEVRFDHYAHRELIGSQFGCQKCHHLSRPGDASPSCSACHRSATAATCIFGHEFHQQKLGGGQSCAVCHDLSQPKGGANIKKCRDCHQDDILKRFDPAKQFHYQAPDYVTAMRDNCIKCHYRMGKSLGLPQIATCDCCHKTVHHTLEEIRPRKDQGPKTPKPVKGTK